MCLCHLSPPQPPSASSLPAADASVCDAGLLYEIETGAYFNVTRLFHYDMGSLTVARRVLSQGCPVMDPTQGQHNYMAVSQCLWWSALV